jgi:16S rRNA (uracil1498-N3)-methyltransferase
MKETRFFFVPEADMLTELPSDEATHAIKVLRLKEGDLMMLMDGKGCFYQAEVTLTANHHCAYRIIEKLQQQRQWQGRVHLAIAPTKMNERMEWMAEKATEVGIDKLTFLNCQFSERRNLKTERIERIIVSAVKQSHKAYMPDIQELTPFDKFIVQHPHGHRFIAHCYNEVERVNLFDQLCQLDSNADVLVLVGPEGDFSIDEVKRAVAAGFVSVNLGDSRLRTETAGLSAVMMMQLAKQINK